MYIVEHIEWVSLPFRCKKTAESCPEELTLLFWAIRLFNGCLVFYLRPYIRHCIGLHTLDSFSWYLLYSLWDIPVFTSVIVWTLSVVSVFWYLLACVIVDVESLRADTGLRVRGKLVTGNLLLLISSRLILMFLSTELMFTVKACNSWVLIFTPVFSTYPNQWLDVFHLKA